MTLNTKKTHGNGQCMSNSMNKSTMIPANQHAQHAEALHYNTLDLCKRLMHKNDLLRACHDENRHLKMMTQQNTLQIVCSNGTQFKMTKNMGNLHVNNDEHQQLKVKN